MFFSSRRTCSVRDEKFCSEGGHDSLSSGFVRVGNGRPDDDVGCEGWRNEAALSAGRDKSEAIVKAHGYRMRCLLDQRGSYDGELHPATPEGLRMRAGLGGKTIDISRGIHRAFMPVTPLMVVDQWLESMDSLTRSRMGRVGGSAGRRETSRVRTSKKGFRGAARLGEEGRSCGCTAVVRDLCPRLPPLDFPR